MTHSPGMFELWSDPQVCRFSGTVRDADGNVIDMPAAVPAHRDLIIDFWVKAANQGWGFRWAVLCVDAMDRFAGIVGFNSVADCSEIAYHLLPSYWGRGFMSEASRAAIKWRREAGAAEIEAFIEPENARSISLACRLGMTAVPEFADGAQRFRMSL